MSKLNIELRDALTFVMHERMHDSATHKQVIICAQYGGIYRQGTFHVPVGDDVPIKEITDWKNLVTNSIDRALNAQGTIIDMPCPACHQRTQINYATSTIFHCENCGEQHKYKVV